VLLLYATLIIYLAMLAVTLLAAFAWGDVDARAAGWITIAGVVATQLAWAVGPRWTAFDPGIFAVDAAMAIGYAMVARRSLRWWPIWLTAAQLASVLTHFAPLAAPEKMQGLYQLSQPAWMFIVLGAIAYGSIRSRPRPIRPSPNSGVGSPPSQR
jgi:hypothetical protein